MNSANNIGLAQSKNYNLLNPQLPGEGSQSQLQNQPGNPKDKKSGGKAENSVRSMIDEAKFGLKDFRSVVNYVNKTNRGYVRFTIGDNGAVSISKFAKHWYSLPTCFYSNVNDHNNVEMRKKFGNALNTAVKYIPRAKQEDIQKVMKAVTGKDYNQIQFTSNRKGLVDIAGRSYSKDALSRKEIASAFEVYDANFRTKEGRRAALYDMIARSKPYETLYGKNNQKHVSKFCKRYFGKTPELLMGGDHFGSSRDVAGGYREYTMSTPDEFIKRLGEIEMDIANLKKDADIQGELLNYLNNCKKDSDVLPNIGMNLKDGIAGALAQSILKQLPESSDGQQLLTLDPTVVGGTDPLNIFMEIVFKSALETIVKKEMDGKPNWNDEDKKEEAKIVYNKLVKVALNFVQVAKAYYLAGLEKDSKLGKKMLSNGNLDSSNNNVITHQLSQMMSNVKKVAKDATFAKYNTVLNEIAENYKAGLKNDKNKDCVDDLKKGFGAIKEVLLGEARVRVIAKKFTEENNMFVNEACNKGDLEDPRSYEQILADNKNVKLLDEKEGGDSNLVLKEFKALLSDKVKKQLMALQINLQDKNGAKSAQDVLKEYQKIVLKEAFNQIENNKSLFEKLGELFSSQEDLNKKNKAQFDVVESILSNFISKYFEMIKYGLMDQQKKDNSSVAYIGEQDYMIPVCMAKSVAKVVPDLLKKLEKEKESYKKLAEKFGLKKGNENIDKLYKTKTKDLIDAIASEVCKLKTRAEKTDYVFSIEWNLESDDEANVKSICNSKAAETENAFRSEVFAQIEFPHKIEDAFSVDKLTTKDKKTKIVDGMVETVNKGLTFTGKYGGKDLSIDLGADKRELGNVHELMNKVCQSVTSSEKMKFVNKHMDAILSNQDISEILGKAQNSVVKTCNDVAQKIPDFLSQTTKAIHEQICKSVGDMIENSEKDTQKYFDDVRTTLPKEKDKRKRQIVQIAESVTTLFMRKQSAGLKKFLMSKLQTLCVQGNDGTFPISNMKKTAAKEVCNDYISSITDGGILDLKDVCDSFYKDSQDIYKYVSEIDLTNQKNFKRENKNDEQLRADIVSMQNELDKNLPDYLKNKETPLSKEILRKAAVNYHNSQFLKMNPYTIAAFKTKDDQLEDLKASVLEQVNEIKKIYDKKGFKNYSLGAVLNHEFKAWQNHLEKMENTGNIPESERKRLQFATLYPSNEDEKMDGYPLNSFNAGSLNRAYKKKVVAWIEDYIVKFTQESSVRLEVATQVREILKGYAQEFVSDQLGLYKDHLAGAKKVKGNPGDYMLMLAVGRELVQKVLDLVFNQIWYKDDTGGNVDLFANPKLNPEVRNALLKQLQTRANTLMGLIKGGKFLDAIKSKLMDVINTDKKSNGNKATALCNLINEALNSETAKDKQLKEMILDDSAEGSSKRNELLVRLLATKGFVDQIKDYVGTCWNSMRGTVIEAFNKNQPDLAKGFEIDEKLIIVKSEKPEKASKQVLPVADKKNVALAPMDKVEPNAVNKSEKRDESKAVEKKEVKEDLKQKEVKPKKPKLNDIQWGDNEKLKKIVASSIASMKLEEASKKDLVGVNNAMQILSNADQMENLFKEFLGNDTDKKILRKLSDTALKDFVEKVRVELNRKINAAFNETGAIGFDTLKDMKLDDSVFYAAINKVAAEKVVLEIMKEQEAESFATVTNAIQTTLLHNMVKDKNNDAYKNMIGELESNVGAGTVSKTKIEKSYAFLRTKQAKNILCKLISIGNVIDSPEKLKQFVSNDAVAKEDFYQIITTKFNSEDLNKYQDLAMDVKKFENLILDQIRELEQLKKLNEEAAREFANGELFINTLKNAKNTKNNAKRKIGVESFAWGEHGLHLLGDNNKVQKVKVNSLTDLQDFFKQFGEGPYSSFVKNNKAHKDIFAKFHKGDPSGFWGTGLFGMKPARQTNLSDLVSAYEKYVKAVFKICQEDDELRKNATAVKKSLQEDIFRNEKDVNFNVGLDEALRRAHSKEPNAYEKEKANLQKLLGNARKAYETVCNADGLSGFIGDFSTLLTQMNRDGFFSEQFKKIWFQSDK